MGPLKKEVYIQESLPPDKRHMKIEDNLFGSFSGRRRVPYNTVENYEEGRG